MNSVKVRISYDVTLTQEDADIDEELPEDATKEEYVQWLATCVRGCGSPENWLKDWQLEMDEADNDTIEVQIDGVDYQKVAPYEERTEPEQSEGASLMGGLRHDPGEDE